MQKGQSSRGRERLERAATTRVAMATMALNGASKTIEKSPSPHTIELVRFPQHSSRQKNNKVTPKAAGLQTTTLRTNQDVLPYRRVL